MAIGGNRGPDPMDKSDEIVKALREYERPFMGTGELADELGYTSNPGVTKHLERAVSANIIEKTTISGYNIWYLRDLVEESQVEFPDSASPTDAAGLQQRLDIVSLVVTSLFAGCLGFVSLASANGNAIPSPILFTILSAITLIVLYPVALSLRRRILPSWNYTIELRPPAKVRQWY